MELNLLSSFSIGFSGCLNEIPAPPFNHGVLQSLSVKKILKRDRRAKNQGFFEKKPTKQPKNASKKMDTGHSKRELGKKPPSQ